MPPDADDMTPDEVQAVAGRALAQGQALYTRGIQEGVILCIDHIEGKLAGGVPYTGPLPDELRAYLARVRESIAEEAP